jgi:hypothetical protein
MGDRIRNERQAREIASLLDDPEMLTSVSQRAEGLTAGGPLTAKVLRQARTEQLLPAEHRERAQELYHQAQVEQAAWEEIDRYCQFIARSMLKYPPQLWSELLDGWAENNGLDQLDAGGRLQGHLTLLVFDATLTEEVCKVFWLAEKYRQIDRPAAAVLTEKVGNFKEIQREAMPPLTKRLNAMARLVPEAANLGTVLAHATSTLAQNLSERLAEVVVGVAEVSAMPEQQYTDDEIETARRDGLRARVQPGDHLMGPLLRSYREYGDLVRRLRGGAE